MRNKKIRLEDTKAFTPFFLDYINEKPTLAPYYNRFPSIGNFSAQIQEKKKSFSRGMREVLVSALSLQYKDVEVSDVVKINIERLANDTTFTVTTGHQLNIFTGPLYFIYKIVTVVNACKRLKEEYPQYDFVPVYWMASEDHDYDEIKSFRLHNKKYVWNTNQTGAVGRFMTNGLAKLCEDLPGDVSVFREAYTKHKKLGDAVRCYVNKLFAADGLVVVDGDDAALKAVFTNVVRDDIFEHNSKKLVDKTNASLETLGYKTQVYCRDINFFYLDDGLRGRIEEANGKYVVVETDLVFTKPEIDELIEAHPERFSPNVILRPLYQEMILPNIAYVGGPAEVIYWLQLKDVFLHFNVPFPVIMPRNFAMIIDRQLIRKFEKTGLELKDIFEDKNYLFNHWVLTHSPRDLTVGIERNDVVEIFEKLQRRAESVDKSLEPFVAAEGKRLLNSLERIERKMLRAEKRLHADRLGQIEAIKDALFPNGSLQERTDNFLNFYQQDTQFIAALRTFFDPFDFQFNILIQNDVH